MVEGEGGFRIQIKGAVAISIPSLSVLEPEFYQQLVRVCEGKMEEGVRELGSGANASSSERAFHIVRILAAATDLMVWASRDDTGEGWSLLP